MSGKFGELQGEAKAALPSLSGEEVRSLQREVATLGTLVAQLAEEQRRTVQTAEGSIRSRLESQLTAHIDTMQNLADQIGEQHQVLGGTMQQLADWTRRHDVSVERLQATYSSVATKGTALASALETAGQRLATHEQGLSRLLSELVQRQEAERRLRQGAALRLVLALVLAALLGAGLAITLPMLSLHQGIPR
jgi:hypothetical protein